MINCESCGAPCSDFSSFCTFCKAPLTIARRKQNRTRGKLTEVFQQVPPQPPKAAVAAVSVSSSLSCPKCAKTLLSDALFCTGCGTNVKKAVSIFCGLCSAPKVAGKKGDAQVCPNCDPDQVLPPVLLQPRRSMVVDPNAQRDATMKLHLTQGTLLNVSSAAPSKAKLIKWNQLLLEREVGEGAYSVVYAAKYHQNIAVAVKVLSMDSSEENKEDFEREVSVLQSLSHPSIVKFHGAVVEDNKLAYVLEFCSNGSLSYLLVRDDIAMSWERRIGWARTVAEGLAYLHGLKPKLIHRDLTSNNLFVTSNFNIRIGDFGLCKAKSLSMEVAKEARSKGERVAAAERAMGLNRLTTARMSTVAFSTSAGTPAFMAPELFSGGLANERIDIYAFGIVLNELCTRDWAFCEMEDDEIRQTVLKGGRPEQASWAPDEMNKLIDKCWNQDPAKRPIATALVTLIKALAHLTWKEPPNANDAF